MKAKAIEYTLKATKQDFHKEKITCSEDAQRYARNFYHDDIEIYESVFVLLLNQSHTAIGYAKISQGGIAGTIVDNVIIAKYAVDALAKGVILVHNHPSGGLHPSMQDKAFTSRAKDALKLFDIRVLDSIILSPEQNKYYSFNDSGIL